MIFDLSIVLLSVATACLPLLLPYAQKLFPGLRLYPAAAWLAVLAGTLMFASILLPDIHISHETATFQQHFVGGGLYAAALYLYCKQLLGWRLHWAADILVLFAWVSALGVANKLAEFTLLKLGLASIDTSDAYWDLLANTLGGFVGFALLESLAKHAKRARAAKSA
jgi:hypothetical protein